MAPTSSRPWPPPPTADRARRSVGERLPRLSTPCCDPVRLPRLSTPCCDPVRLGLRRPVESGLPPAVGVLDQPAGRLPALDRHHEGVAGELAAEVVGHARPDDL